MTTITKERIELFVKSPLENGLTRGEQMELARIALASLEAEPIGAFHIVDQQVGGTSDYIKDGEWPIDNGVIDVYAAPPAPVVPDDGRAEFEAWMLKKWGRERQEYDFAMGKFLHGENYADSYTRHMWKAWTESRAAMLQSKYRDLSQPVDPQISEYEKIMLRAGWAMVPVEPTDEMIAAAMNCEDVLFNSDESFCVQFGNIYEAMLAAAPQPEANNE
ncbi:hypothetical protein LO27_06170 [Salmonella enterica]|nr:hypothetical protein [Salmonella enterica]EAM9431157.1 hypothetical protein [Salmonella enterica]EAO7617638.1 hypothetical protein [Salmonella enterica]EAQ6818486.1 hypothetical protein [Salmonella enterica]EAS2106791.1 hypothetical protein [Salmonella enterica]